MWNTGNVSVPLCLACGKSKTCFVLSSNSLLYGFVALPDDDFMFVSYNCFFMFRINAKLDGYLGPWPVQTLHSFRIVVLTSVILLIIFINRSIDILIWDNVPIYSWFGRPRPFIPGFYKKLSRKDQQKLQRRAKKNGLGKMVIHYRGRDGKKKLYGAKLFDQPCSLGSLVRWLFILVVHIRCGGPKLKESQVYPRGYGRQVQKLHAQHIVPWI